MINIREHLKQGQNNHKGQSGQGGMPQIARSELKKKKKEANFTERAKMRVSQRELEVKSSQFPERGKTRLG